MMTWKVGELEYRFEIHPAYDNRDRPNGDQHDADFCFYIKGEKGAVQFIVYSGWYSGLIAKPDRGWLEWSHCKRHAYPHDLSEPMAADLGYHSPVPRYDDQSPMDIADCPVIGGVCYYDGSSLNGGRLLSLLIHEGDEAMWNALEEYYYVTFGQPAMEVR